MTDRHSLNLVRLEKIRRLAHPMKPGPATAVAPPVRMRKRRVFGPLFYSTVVLAGITLPYVGAIRLAEWREREVKVPTDIDPERAIAVSVTALSSDDWQSRVKGAISFKALLQQRPPVGGNLSPSWERAVAALGTALEDPVGAVRAAAADAVGASPQTALALKNALIAALDDENSSVRLSAARALLNGDADSKTQALRKLAALVVDTPFIRERNAALETMASAGEEGQAAGVAAFVRRLSNVDDPLESGDYNCASMLEPQPFWLALEPLLKSDDPRVRTAAALAAGSISWPPGGPAAIAMPSGPDTSPSSPAPITVASFRSQFVILEQAVCDTSMSFELREQALNKLISGPMLVPLHRCGLALAHQLELPDTARRVAAARLLHMIDPDTLAGINVPEESP
jgi:hypothetical protein